ILLIFEQTAVYEPGDFLIPFNTKNLIQSTEKIAVCLNQTFKKYNLPILIGIGGKGGSGKSEFSNLLIEHLDNSSIIRTDDYRQSRLVREKSKLLGSHPEANKLDLLSTHIDLIKQGETFEKPVYDGKSGTDNNTEVYKPNRFNIIEGEMVCNDLVRMKVDYLIYITSSLLSQLVVRIKRDTMGRKNSLFKTMNVFLKSNLIDFRKFNHGCSDNAHTILKFRLISGFSIVLKNKLL
ncbi:P-loop NTPase fold protein, partial [Bacteroidota bacterium]